MNKEETVIMKNRPILSRVILYSGVALIVALIIFLKLTCEDEQTKIKRWQHIKLLGNVLYYMYKQDGKLPSQKKYLTYFKSDLLDKNFYKRNDIFYKYSPDGWTAPDGRNYRVIVWDKPKQTLYKIAVDETKIKTATDERDCIDIYSDPEPYFPEWSKTP